MDADDPFERLPKELVKIIIQKLPNNLKFLIQTSLVSHLFASLILQISDVKLIIPSNLRGIQNLESSSSQLIFGFSRSITGLKNFIQINSLHLETDNSFAFWDPTSKAANSSVPMFHFLEILAWTETNLWRDLLVKIIQDFPLIQSIGISNPYRSVNEIYLSGEELIKFKELNARGVESSKWKIIGSLFSRAWGL